MVQRVSRALRRRRWLTLLGLSHGTYLAEGPASLAPLFSTLRSVTWLLSAISAGTSF